VEQAKANKNWIGGGGSANRLHFGNTAADWHSWTVF
jgi:hypothetical protein